MSGHRKDLARDTTEASASEVKNAWHEYVERVSRGREIVTVTRYGKPALQLTPMMQDTPSDGIFGFLTGSISIVGDITGPLDEPWDADG